MIAAIESQLPLEAEVRCGVMELLRKCAPSEQVHREVGREPEGSQIDRDRTVGATTGPSPVAVLAAEREPARRQCVMAR